MKKRVVYFLLLFIISFSIQSQNMDLQFVRLNYKKAVSDKELCSAMIAELKAEKNNNTFLAYLGGLQTIWASHIINPFSKLESFNRGKQNLEKAVALASSDIEIRFIRLSVQRNTPKFLGYHHQIEVDEAFIKQHKQSITSPSLLHLLNTL